MLAMLHSAEDTLVCRRSATNSADRNARPAACLPSLNRSRTIDAMTDADPALDADPQPESQTLDQLRLPQFGIIHLLLWTAVAAVLLKFFLAVREDSARQSGAVMAWTYQVAQSLYAIMLAGTLVGSGVLVMIRTNVKFRRLQPGHWLALSCSITGALSVALWPLYRLVETLGPHVTWLAVAGTATIDAVTAIFLGLAVVLLRDARRWRTLIAAAAVADATAAITYAIYAVAELRSDFSLLTLMDRWHALASMAWSAAVLAMLLTVLALDLPRRLSRDWLHWLGVVAFGIISVMPGVCRAIEEFLPHFR
jgi:hypothetical protein